MHPTLQSLRGRLIVSCQADPGSPFRAVEHIVAFARAAEAGGAAGVRIQSLEDVRAVRAAVKLPVIGLIKRKVPGFDAYITTTPAEVTALASAGAEIVAFDATTLSRPHPVVELVAAAHQAGVLTMADCATLDDVRRAVAAGADLVGTTMSGYTPDSPRQERPDFALVEAASQLPGGVPVVAEGRIASPADAAEAIRCGAFCVVVGSAITRPETVVGWYAAALDGAR